MKNLRKIAVLGFVLALAAPIKLTAQNDTLRISAHPDSVYAHFLNASKSSVFDGFTIQLYSGSREGAYQIRAKIIELGTQADARLVYKEPNFKIHVGSFPTAAMAERELLRWTQEFPDAFVVQTLVPWYPTGTQEEPNAAQPSSTAAPSK